MYLEQISDSMNASGVVPVVVPCHRGVDQKANDISWTAAYVLITQSMSTYYGAAHVASQHWPNRTTPSA